MSFNQLYLLFGHLYTKLYCPASGFYCNDESSLKNNMFAIITCQVLAVFFVGICSNIVDLSNSCNRRAVFFCLKFTSGYPNWPLRSSSVKLADFST